MPASQTAAETTGKSWLAVQGSATEQALGLPDRAEPHSISIVSLGSHRAVFLAQAPRNAAGRRRGESRGGGNGNGNWIPQSVLTGSQSRAELRDNVCVCVCVYVRTLGVVIQRIGQIQCYAPIFARRSWRWKRPLAAGRKRGKWIYMDGIGTHTRRQKKGKPKKKGQRKRRTETHGWYGLSVS